MPRFHFNMRDSRTPLDADGVDLEEREVYAAAMKMAADFMYHRATGPAVGAAWHLDVVDGDAALMYRLEFRVIDVRAPARSSR